MPQDHLPPCGWASASPLWAWAGQKVEEGEIHCLCLGRVVHPLLLLATSAPGSRAFVLSWASSRRRTNPDTSQPP